MALEDSLLETFKETRARTLELTSTLEHDDYAVQTAPYASPPKWHIGHTSWIYEAVMSKMIRGYEFYSQELSEYLNSYYMQFGVPLDKGSRGMARPTTTELLEYFGVATKRAKALLEQGGLSEHGARLMAMAVHHECQHQELLVYDIQHMLAERYRPAKRNAHPDCQAAGPRMVEVKGGTYRLGHAGHGYCYDIELPEHDVLLQDYEMGAHPVTNAEYLEFMQDGGYGSYKYWLADGWEAASKEGWDSPMYWQRDGEGWRVKGFGGLVPVDPDRPVCHVSYYEADAYCRWAKKRLPTEAEWEKAACWDGDAGEKRAYPWGDGPPTGHTCNLLESYRWGCSKVGSYPAGASPCGCEQMIGDVWEWTSSEFAGYPGFVSGFDEYNDKWFANQKVLRGGSFATPSISIRASYRNFFRPHERWMFAGFRCASGP